MAACGHKGNYEEKEEHVHNFAKWEFHKHHDYKHHQHGEAHKISVEQAKEKCLKKGFAGFAYHYKNGHAFFKTANAPFEKGKRNKDQNVNLYVMHPVKFEHHANHGIPNKGDVENGEYGSLKEAKQHCADKDYSCFTWQKVRWEFHKHHDYKHHDHGHGIEMTVEEAQKRCLNKGFAGFAYKYKDGIAHFKKEGAKFEKDKRNKDQHVNLYVAHHEKKAFFKKFDIEVNKKDASHAKGIDLYIMKMKKHQPE